MAPSYDKPGHHEHIENDDFAPISGASTNLSSDPDAVLKHRGHGDRALDLAHGGQRVHVSEEDDKRIRRKTDRTILAVLVWIYFLQIFDKSVLGYGAVFGLQRDTHLEGNQYSLVGSIAPIAQLCVQPFTSVLIVKVPHRILMPALALGWGISQAAMAACNSYGDLIATRFFLGLFEGGCLPLFSVITSHWYRRAEQPLRVAAWYGTNGIATIVAAAVSYGLGQIHSDSLRPWQIIFLFAGLITIVSVPIAYWRLDSSVSEARFLTEHEKAQAIERLRANQTGTGSRKFDWHQVLEAFLEPKTWLFVGMALLNNLGAQVANTFGPLILQGLGFNKSITSLLNMPFGAIQFIIIMVACYAAQKAKWKSIVLASLMLPVIAGLVMLYLLPHTPSNEAPLLVGYYLLAFLFGGNPLIVSWIVANTAGTTKKSALMSLYNAGSSAGNIIGPLLFVAADAPTYRPGLRKCLGVFSAMVALVLVQLANLMWLNRLQARRRVGNGKPERIQDASMRHRYHDMDADDAVGEGADGAAGMRLGEQAFLDLTDRQNDEFVYVY